MANRRVFVDTNVLLSGLIFKGNESGLLQLALDGEIRLIVADVVLAEARSVLEAKFPRHSRVLDEFLSLVDFERVPMPGDEAIESARLVVRDPNDAPILASMFVSGPDFAVTGDKDLLTDEVRALAPVVTCSEFLTLQSR